MSTPLSAVIADLAWRENSFRSAVSAGGAVAVIRLSAIAVSCNKTVSVHEYHLLA